MNNKITSSTKGMFAAFWPACFLSLDCNLTCRVLLNLISRKTFEVAFAFQCDWNISKCISSAQEDVRRKPIAPLPNQVEATSGSHPGLQWRCASYQNSNLVVAAVPYIIMMLNLYENIVLILHERWSVFSTDTRIINTKDTRRSITMAKTFLKMIWHIRCQF